MVPNSFAERCRRQRHRFCSNTSNRSRWCCDRAAVAGACATQTHFCPHGNGPLTLMNCAQFRSIGRWCTAHYPCSASIRKLLRPEYCLMTRMIGWRAKMIGRAVLCLYLWSSQLVVRVEVVCPNWWHILPRFQRWRPRLVELQREKWYRSRISHFWSWLGAMPTAPFTSANKCGGET